MKKGVKKGVPLISHPVRRPKMIESYKRGQRILAWNRFTLKPRLVRDAAHVPVAAANDVDHPLTWNCTLLANARIIRRVSVLCNREGYNMRVICTPEELMGGQYDMGRSDSFRSQVHS